MVNSPENWLRKGSLTSYSVNWQRPAKTEEWIFETILKKESYSPYVEYIAFPWATLIDLLDRNKIESAQILLNQLDKLEPKRTIIRASSCQHINMEKYIHLFEKLQITDLFWSHKRIGLQRIHNIRLHPLALYPYAFEEYKYSNSEPLNRDYLVSFVGAYDPECYISKIRDDIINTNKKKYKDIKIIQRDCWHFEAQVYGEQINLIKQTEAEKQKQKNNFEQFCNILSRTRYSLCPSGSGPNSIRFWESLAFGCIPVLLSDTLDLPAVVKDYVYIICKEVEYEKFLNNIFFEKKIIDHEFNCEFRTENFISEVTSQLFTTDYINKLTA